MDETQLRQPLQLKIVGSNHRDAPGALLPVCALNGLNPRRSLEQNLPSPMCGSFYTQKVINDVITPMLRHKRRRLPVTHAKCGASPVWKP